MAANRPEVVKVGNTSVMLKQGDITDETTDAIVNLNNEKLNQNFGVSKSILAAAGPAVQTECTRLVSGGLKKDGVVVTAAGDLDCEIIIHLINVTPATIISSVKKALKICDQHKLTIVTFPAIGTGTASGSPADTIPAMLDGIVKYLAETQNTTLRVVEIVVLLSNLFKKCRTAFLNKKAQMQKQPPGTIKVKIKFPKTWTGMDQQELKIVPLKKSTEEYRGVEEKFLRSNGDYKVMKIERIQNVVIFKSFFLKKKTIKKRTPDLRTVRHLYHGTSADSIQNINKGGFNRSYMGLHATMYGKGCYFAVNAWYSSSSTYSRPDKDGKKYVYQVAVITGRYCTGTSATKEPPHIDNNPNNDRYDSVVDNVNNPEMFIVFHDDYTYPEYLITFK
ncbi:protein mono-ADP-ribosyltransferase PARP15-like [Hyperolius riggenbachi]|uniref:protein mono-ADP-ribosyltransferase PARP15-like n=1 Tax=Hyperolius riggenbachi TaxID=752182 RepID=UPI0035A2A5C4